MPQYALTAASQSVFYGVSEKVVFAWNCRLYTGDARLLAAEAGAPEAASRPPLVAVVGVAASAGPLRPTGLMLPLFHAAMCAATFETPGRGGGSHAAGERVTQVNQRGSVEVAAHPLPIVFTWGTQNAVAISLSGYSLTLR